MNEKHTEQIKSRSRLTDVKIDPRTAYSVDLATRDIVKTLSPTADGYEGFILGFAAGWTHFTNEEAGARVFKYLDDTL